MRAEGEPKLNTLGLLELLVEVLPDAVYERSDAWCHRGAIFGWHFADYAHTAPEPHGFRGARKKTRHNLEIGIMDVMPI